MNRYYQMPIRFDLLMERGQEHALCNTGASIAQHIFLIISSRFQEHRFDSRFGCELWDRDFELVTNVLVWQEQLSKSIQDTLQRFERRLERISVNTLITEAAYWNPLSRMRAVKKRVTIEVRGLIKSTGETFLYAPQLYLGPVSVD